MNPNKSLTTKPKIKKYIKRKTQKEINKSTRTNKFGFNDSLKKKTAQ